MHKESGARELSLRLFLFFQLERVLGPNNQAAAKCIGERFRDLQLSAPPHASWPVSLSINIGPENAPRLLTGGLKLMETGVWEVDATISRVQVPRPWVVGWWRFRFDRRAGRSECDPECVVVTWLAYPSFFVQLLANKWSSDDCVAGKLVSGPRFVGAVNLLKTPVSEDLCLCQKTVQSRRRRSVVILQRETN